MSLVPAKCQNYPCRNLSTISIAISKLIPGLVFLASSDERICFGFRSVKVQIQVTLCLHHKTTAVN
jgi:hypothetical protein